jgi:hypothetical protein
VGSLNFGDPQGEGVGPRDGDGGGGRLGCAL